MKVSDVMVAVGTYNTFLILFNTFCNSKYGRMCCIDFHFSGDTYLDESLRNSLGTTENQGVVTLADKLRIVDNFSGKHFRIAMVRAITFDTFIINTGMCVLHSRRVWDSSNYVDV